MTNEQTKEKIKEAISKVEIHVCEMCGGFLLADEYEKGEGVCFKHWDE